MSKKQNKTTSIILLLVMVVVFVGIVGNSDVYAGTGINQTQDEILSKINDLNSKLGGTYFNVGHSASSCYGETGGHSCNNCYSPYIFSQGWFVDIFGDVDYRNLPTTSGGVGPDGSSCYGFANFAEWYIFKTSNSDKVEVRTIGTYTFNSQLCNYAVVGDVLRLHSGNPSSGHSVIYIDSDSTGINVLDCNWRYGGQKNCIVQKHHINYAGYGDRVTICRASSIETGYTGGGGLSGFTRNMSVGSSGSDVLWVQQCLNAVQGAGLVEDGVFGNATKSAVIAFQSAYGLEADGIVGIQTYGKMQEVWEQVKTQVETKKHNPQGNLDEVYSTQPGMLYVKGWAFDSDNSNGQLDIDVYVGGPVGSVNAERFRITTDVERSDINSVYGIGGNHGFSTYISTTKTGTVDVYAYALNTGDGNENTLIGHFLTEISKSDLTSFYFNWDFVHVTIGSKRSLRKGLVIRPKDSKAQIEWISKDNSIATVSSEGIVTGKSVGDTYVTAKCEGFETSLHIFVDKLVVNVEETNSLYPGCVHLKGWVYNGIEGNGDVMLNVAVGDSNEEWVYDIGILYERDDLFQKYGVKGKIGFDTYIPTSKTGRQYVSLYAKTPDEEYTNCYCTVQVEIAEKYEPQVPSSLKPVSVLSRFEMYDFSTSWEEAEKFAEKKGGHLATVSSLTDLTVLYRLLRKSEGMKSYYYLGGSDRDSEGYYTWVNGESRTYIAKYWASNVGQPDNMKDFCSTGESIMCLNKNDLDNFGWYDISEIEYLRETTGFIVEYEIEGQLGKRICGALFPDDNFREFISSNVDKDKNGWLSDQELKIQILSCANKNISDLTGVELFVDLRELDCYGNSLTSLDLTSNPALETIYCFKNQLTSLNVNGCSELKILNCRNNQLKSLDVSQNTNLKDLCASDNRIEGINLESNTKLTSLWIDNNRLVDLDLSKCTDLYSISCVNNQLKSLDFSNNNKASDVSCGYNRLTSLKLGNNSKLDTLICYCNSLVSLDLSGCTGLRVVKCQNNKLTSLKTQYNTRLAELYCGYNELSSLDLSKNTDLQILVCYSNRLTELNLNTNSKLTMLNCANNLLKNLAVKDKANLTSLSCYGNKIALLPLNDSLMSIYTKGESDTGSFSYSENGVQKVIYYSRYKYNASGSNRNLEIDTFTKVGEMLIGWQDIGGDKYYYGTDGIVLVGFQSIDGKMYYFGIDGVMQLGWLNIKEKWYYMNTDGTMTIGWKKLGGKWYYFGAQGVMRTGWQKISKKWYYFNASGAMLTGWQKISKKWYYFNASGAMLTGWQQIRKKWYLFDKSGTMLTGWKTSGNKTYYFKKDGSMASDEWWGGYYLNKDGSWTYKPKASWKKDSKGWYFIDTKGWYAKNTTITIDGKKYSFDTKGYLK